MEQQARTRRAVLTAARAEFAERGYSEAKIDRIAERAELTRGAVYSNFPSKRALYLAVLLDGAEPARTRDPSAPPAEHTRSHGQAAEQKRAMEPADEQERAAGHAAEQEPAAGSTAEREHISGLLPATERNDPGRVNQRSPAAELEALDVPGAVEAFARVWLERLPLAYDDNTAGRLRARSLTGVFDDDERGRAALAQLTWLEALLLAVALESCRARGAGRRVRLAELILTMLHGAATLAETAPGFGDAFDVAGACRHLAGLDVADEWNPPYLPYVAPARPVAEAWVSPGAVADELSGRSFEVGDGVVVLLGAGRLGSAEDAVRSARPGEVVIIAVVTDDPAETGALVRLRLNDLATMLRQIFGPAFRPSLRLVLDESGALASAMGATPAFDTETSVRIKNGEIVARSDGRGAGHATAIARETP